MRVKIESVEVVLTEKLQQRLEGRCSRHGYVIPGSLKVLSRSMGSLEKGRFTGSIIFHIQAEGKVLNPPDGAIIEGVVIRKNKMGMYVSYMEDAIRVIIPRDLHIGDEAFETVEIGEKVEVEVKKSRFQVNDPYILSVGTFRSSKGKKAAKAPAPPVAPKPEEESEEAAEAADDEAEAADGEESEAAEESEGAEAAAEDEAAAD